MNNPVVNEPGTRKVKTKVLPYRKEEFVVEYQYYVDDEGEEFITPELGDANLSQVYNSYRIKHGIPMPDEIKKIRQDYGLSAAKMSEILGLGPNSYRNYENGEVPTESIGHFIRAAANPVYFRSLVDYSTDLSEKEIKKITTTIDRLIEEKKSLIIDKEEYIMAGKMASEYTGYKVPDLNKALNVIVFFAENMKPWQTVLNKLLFYADFGHCKKTGQSITGLSYRAITYGVVPSNYDKLFSEAVEQQVVSVRYQVFDNSATIGQQYIPSSEQVSKFNPELFTVSELETLENIVIKFSNFSTNDIIKANHEEKAWLDYVQSRDIVSYKESFHLQHL